MRARALLGALLALTVACGGEEAASDDTAVVGTPDTGVATIPSDGGSDTGVTPATTPDTVASGSQGDRPGQGTTPSAPIAGADTAVGVVHIMGTAVDNRVVVQTSAGPIAVVGDHAETIRKLQGMEVWVQGPLSVAMGRVIPPRQITAERFEVRSVNGVPVVDGTLRERGGNLVVERANGERQNLMSPPAELRNLVGQRVWVLLGDGGRVESFGALVRIED